MLTPKLVAIAFFVSILEGASAYPKPNPHKEKIVVHTPVKVKVIHHYHVEKVPLVINKHVHQHEPSWTDEHHHIRHSFDDELDDGHSDIWNDESCQLKKLPHYEVHEDAEESSHEFSYENEREDFEYK